jgi:catechol 2,3-dioxygenase-like lactoylglutathione lyase family enzyme
LDATVSAERSSLVGGLNHVAQVTRNLDRLTNFYADVFDVPFAELPPHRDRRHGFLLLGRGSPDGDPGPMLHVFELPEEATGPFGPADQMFRRGRLDHLAIEAADEHALAEVRDRLVELGASDGVVRVFGGWLLSVNFVDPDGMRLEVGCRWSGVRFADEDVVAG